MKYHNIYKTTSKHKGMIKINIPFKLTDALALDLLDQTLSESITMEEIIKFDFLGKEAAQQRKNFKETFIYKTVAALGYEDFDDITNSAYCYERAAKSALEIKLPLTSIECTSRALSYYISLIRKSENEEEIQKCKKEITTFMAPRIMNAARLLRSKDYLEETLIVPKNIQYIWFKEIKTETASYFNNHSSLSANP